ncbi:hypothetical protein COU16_00040 [Candidatus Kaiserbacteria bacterium CG10_big_fil_rev_8_21_14_0_10_47_16]|uniref:Uncharacterized protein n=1 Tax=Candidatus Kaiserbacteria bacterium CG10_big_fil_rev_8_21_14_0_10_47_16 TaxID=1974608 RepID=A0A2H0UES9_9BACT|nr:MAG: hypothetical protein COU16_00040 [Candidatus Kaiserbacteria bacterium CG10_big_fil_rev_8_21_14_0_10_47_16]
MRCYEALQRGEDIIRNDEQHMLTYIISAGIGGGMPEGETFAAQMKDHMFPDRPNFTLFEVNYDDAVPWGLYREIEWAVKAVREMADRNPLIEVPINTRSWPRVKFIARQFPDVEFRHVPSFEPPASRLHETLGWIKLLMIRIPIFGPAAESFRRRYYWGGY